MMYDFPGCVKSDWAVEPRVIKPGIVAARSLLDDSQVNGIVRVVNCSGKPYVFSPNSFLGLAEPVEVIGTTVRNGPSANRLPSRSGSTTGLKMVNRTDGSTRLAVATVQPANLLGQAARPESDSLEHIQCLINQLPNELSPSQREQAVKFIQSKAHVFSRSELDIGRTDVIKHRIDTGDNQPHFEPLRRHPTCQLPIIDEHVDAMLEHDVIEPAASPWCSNVVMVRKHDGTMRFCVDYPKTKELIKDKFPLPKIDTCLYTLNGCRFFSSCDLRQGYWHTLIDERDRDKTAFVTRKGQWRFKVLSFGLCNAPSQFARTMELVLSGLTYDQCLVYLDDILIFSKTFEEHCQRLAAVFRRLEEHSLKLKASKCHLFQLKVTFLGHVVSERGVECDPDKVAAISDWPRPTNVSEVRTFCGLASYYRSFVEGFAHIARPLHELTRKNAVFQWTDACERAFRILKDRLTNAPILAAPCDDGEFVLDTDASDTAVGIVLQQQQGDVLRVIGYASRALSDAERRYCITRRELLAIVYGLKKYRQHLLGRPIVIRTDHAALTYLMRTPEPIGQQGRWLDLLSEFNFVIKHRPGRVHGNSDALSRRPCARNPDESCRQCKDYDGLLKNDDPSKGDGPSAPDGPSATDRQTVSSGSSDVGGSSASNGSSAVDRDLNTTACRLTRSSSRSASTFDSQPDVNPAVPDIDLTLDAIRTTQLADDNIRHVIGSASKWCRTTVD